VTAFVHSQFEARFFEDPVTWLSMGMLALLGQFETGGTEEKNCLRV